MKGKKEAKEKQEKASTVEDAAFGQITTKSELKSFLAGLRDKMTDQTAAPVYALSAMNHVLNIPEIYQFLDNENKELARDIWLRLKQAGVQIKNPPMLFGSDLDGPPAASR